MSNTILKKICVVFMFAFLAKPGFARDTQYFFSLKEALSTDSAKQKLDSSIELYFGKEKHRKISEEFSILKTSRKTSSFGKSDKKACQWVLLSALIALQEGAKKRGCNAVVDIQSNYNKHLMSSETEFECHSGNIIAGVALAGKCVNLTAKSADKTAAKSSK